MNAGEGNTIGFNGHDGINVSGTRNIIRGNSIFSNGTLAADLGIDLGPDGVTANDTGDGDTGANNLQNFPLISSAKVTGSLFTINGTLNSNASRTYTIDFYSNVACDTSGNGEGKTYLGSLSSVATDGSGNASFTFHPSAMNVGAVITATATDVTLFDDDNNVNTPMVPHNDTSEFSPCVTAVAGTPGTLQFSASNYNDTELNSSTHTVTITVIRTAGSDGPASVHYATGDGTATASSDYDSTSGDFNWTDGDATDRTFTVTVHGDTTYEANETVKLTLSSVTGATISGANPATLTIVNDDAPPTTLTVNTTDDMDNGAWVLRANLGLDHPSECHRVAFRHVRAHDQDAVGMLEVHGKRRCPTPPE